VADDGFDLRQTLDIDFSAKVEVPDKILSTVNRRYSGSGYNGQSRVVYSCEFLEMLRYKKVL
jgi:hypothetical protein